MGLTFEKLIVILVIAVFVLGPERLPEYAKKLSDLVRSLKKLSESAKDRLRDEMGDEFDEVDWQKLDPRQYDPRRIIRDALLEDEPGGGSRGGASTLAAGAGAVGAAAARTGATTSGESSANREYDSPTGGQ